MPDDAQVFVVANEDEDSSTDHKPGISHKHTSSSSSAAESSTLADADTAAENSVSAVALEQEPFLAGNSVDSAKPIQRSQMGFAESFDKPEGRSGDGIANVAATVAMSILLLTTWLVVLINDPVSLSWFAFHPPLQVLAIALFTYGIMTLQPTSQPRTKAAGLTRHQLYILFTGLPAIAVGTWVMIHSKNVRRREHFTSWHGLLGILAIAWMTVQILIGGGSVWFGGAAFGGGAKAKGIWRYHRISGYMLYALFLYTIHLGGAWSGFYTKHCPHWVRLLAYTFAPIAVLAAVFSRARLSKMKIF